MGSPIELTYHLTGHQRDNYICGIFALLYVAMLREDKNPALYHLSFQEKKNIRLAIVSHLKEASDLNALFKETELKKLNKQTRVHTQISSIDDL